MALYLTDRESVYGPGVPITTQSMMKAFRQCPREVFYKYVLRLQPKVASQPLTRGKWMHALLETYYRGDESPEGEAWEREHKRWTLMFSRLFDEEKERLGDLPREIDTLMRSYLWHYANDATWEVVAVEQTLEAMMPNGHLLRGRVDMIVRDHWGRLWIVDHKTHKRLPDWDLRQLDEQSPIYIWLARENGYDVQGFVWNYLSTAGISRPKIVKAGTRFYANTSDSDWPTYSAAVKAGLAEYPDTFIKDPEDRAKVKAELTRLKNQRHEDDRPQDSPHFRRDAIEKSEGMIQRVLASTMRTSDEMHGYDWDDADSIPRTVNSCKGFMCSYRSLTIADLVNGDSDLIKRREYRSGDPLAYYGTDDERIDT